MRWAGSVALRRARASWIVPSPGFAQSIGTVTVPQSTPAAVGHGFQSTVSRAAPAGAASRAARVVAAAVTTVSFRPRAMRHAFRW
ncbi:hypothetical protein AB0383_26580 [Amycolatopsis sp. NPDC051373]|uniref:hypothetical protein n=1 Tax=Amycolatopsis sp. NPDC051373 TaxID=3155801 RepID=UPI0034502872